VEITQLGMEHEKALLNFLADFTNTGEMDIPGYFADSDWSHAEIVENLARMSRGEGLPDGWVPGTTSFLVHEGEILGVSNLRHRLTCHLLRFGGHVGFSVKPSARCRGHATRLLEGAKALARVKGIDRLLVTCNAENVASVRVIEKCGGVLEDEMYLEDVGEVIRRYWIAL